MQILSMRYKTGHKRLPRMAGQGPEGPAYLREKIRELTAFVPGRVSGIVRSTPMMSDWIGEFNLLPIVQAAKRGPGQPLLANARLPRYLVRQQHEIPLRPEEVSS